MLGNTATGGTKSFSRYKGMLGRSAEGPVGPSGYQDKPPLKNYAYINTQN